MESCSVYRCDTKDWDNMPSADLRGGHWRVTGALVDQGSGGLSRN